MSLLLDSTEPGSVSCPSEVGDSSEGFFLPIISLPQLSLESWIFWNTTKGTWSFLLLSVFVVFTTSPPFLRQGLFRHKLGLGIAPQNSNQELSPILVGKSQHRTGDPIMTESRILVLPLRQWLKILVQISLGNYTEISFIQSITQDLLAHSSSQFVLCDN